jgi:uncharacterized glyoxalase superfamily protein PhnB
MVTSRRRSGAGSVLRSIPRMPIPSFDPEWMSPSRGHRTTIAFLCDSPDDVDRLYEQLVEAGTPSYKPPWDAFWSQRYAQVKDPDGNVVDLFAPLGAST